MLGSSLDRRLLGVGLALGLLVNALPPVLADTPGAGETCRSAAHIVDPGAGNIKMVVEAPDTEGPIINRSVRTSIPLIHAILVTTEEGLEATVDMVCIKRFTLELWRTGPEDPFTLLASEGLQGTVVVDFDDCNTGTDTRWVGDEVVAGDGISVVGIFELDLRAEGCDGVVHTDTEELYIVNPW